MDCGRPPAAFATAALLRVEENGGFAAELRQQGWLRESGSMAAAVQKRGSFTVLGGDGVEGKSTDGAKPGRCHGGFEFRCTAPRPLGSPCHQTVMTGILMHVVEPRQIASLPGEKRLAIVLPKSCLPWRFIFGIQPLG